MKRVLTIILLFILAFAACRKDDSSSSNDFGLLHSDQKDEAAKIVESANQDLKKVKEIYKTNQGRIEEIKTAMQNKDVDKVKTIADDLVIKINDGLSAADDAVKKIEKAQAMDINDTYKTYLELKKGALEKQIAAFELRRQVAQLVRDSFGGKDVAKIDQAQALFKEKEEQFKKLIEDGKDLSEQANQVYKDSLKKN